MRGTCLEVAPQKIEGEDELFVFSFFQDSEQNRDIGDLISTLQGNMKNSLNALNKYIHSWRNFKHIWRQDKARRTHTLIHTYTHIHTSTVLLPSSSPQSYLPYHVYFIVASYK